MGAAKGEEFLRLLEEEGISMAALCRRTGLSGSTIRKYMKQARRARGDPERGTASFSSQTPPKHSRNVEVYQARHRGLSWSRLSRKFGVSERRCQEIVRVEEQRRREVKTLRARSNGRFARTGVMEGG